MTCRIQILANISNIPFKKEQFQEHTYAERERGWYRFSYWCFQQYHTNSSGRQWRNYQVKYLAVSYILFDFKFKWRLRIGSHVFQRSHEKNWNYILDKVVIILNHGSTLLCSFKQHKLGRQVWSLICLKQWQCMKLWYLAPDSVHRGYK